MSGRIGQYLGFTLVELLVVAIIAILASTLLPVLDWSKVHLQGIQCVSHRQLARALQIHAEENGGHSAVNASIGSNYSTVGDNPSWETGILSTNAAPDANEALPAAYVRFAFIGGYVQKLGSYHCAGDISCDPGNHQFWVRSISMNYWINPGWTKTTTISSG